MHAIGRLPLTLTCLAVAGLLVALATACEEEEGATTATPRPTATAAVTTTPTPVATPTAATPSPVPSPTATATPEVVAAPLQPSDFADYPAAIAGHLTMAGGSPSCLAELFAAWDMPTAVPAWAEESGAVDCAAGDLDGDGEDEYLLRVTNPVVSAVWPDSEVLIFDRGVAGYEVAFQSGPGASQPVILGIRDFNGDGKLEASFTVASYGSNTFWTFVRILAWDGQQYVDLFPQVEGSLGIPNARDIRFVDAEGDGIEELYVAAGQVGSIGAGPQKDANLTYAWDGTNYVLVETEYEPSDWLYFAVVDGDEAYAAGDLETAMQLYNKAINDTSLRDWKAEYGGEPTPSELIPYAYFRLYLTQLASLPPDAGPSAQDLIDSIAALLEDFKLSLHAQAAYQFAQAYPDGEVSPEALSQGCAAFLAYVEDNREGFDAAWDYGYANPELVPERLCPH